MDFKFILSTVFVPGQTKLTINTKSEKWTFNFPFYSIFKSFYWLSRDLRFFLTKLFILLLDRHKNNRFFPPIFCSIAIFTIYLFARIVYGRVFLQIYYKLFLEFYYVIFKIIFKIDQYKFASFNRLIIF